ARSRQAGVRDVWGSLRFDAGDGSNGGDEYCEAKPSEPAHDNVSIHVDPTLRTPPGRMCFASRFAAVTPWAQTRFDSRLSYVDHLERRGCDLFAAACRLDIEG